MSQPTQNTVNNRNFTHKNAQDFRPFHLENATVMTIGELDRQIDCLLDRIRSAANATVRPLEDRYFVVLQLRLALDYCRVRKTMLQFPAAQLPHFDPMQSIGYPCK